MLKDIVTGKKYLTTKEITEIKTAAAQKWVATFPASDISKFEDQLKKYFPESKDHL